jgi:hypothetical protein
MRIKVPPYLKITLTAMALFDMLYVLIGSGAPLVSRTGAGAE